MAVQPYRQGFLWKIYSTSAGCCALWEDYSAERTTTPAAVIIIIIIVIIIIGKIVEIIVMCQREQLVQYGVAGQQDYGSNKLASRQHIAAVTLCTIVSIRAVHLLTVILHSLSFISLQPFMAIVISFLMSSYHNYVHYLTEEKKKININNKQQQRVTTNTRIEFLESTRPHWRRSPIAVMSGWCYS